MPNLPTLDEAADWQAKVYDDLPEYDPDNPRQVHDFVWEAYSQGDCRMYAYAAAWLLNMRVADCGPHAVVLDAEGRMFDATGEVDEAEIVDRYFRPGAEITWWFRDRDDVEEGLIAEVDPVDPDQVLLEDENVRAAIGALIHLDTPLREMAREKAERAFAAYTTPAPGA